MRKKQMKPVSKPIREKKPIKKPSNKKKVAKPIVNPKKEKKESEIASESLQSNKSQIGEIEEISKKSEMPKVKTYEIITEEETSYLLNFEQVKDKLRIKVIEKNSFPQNEFENFYTLEDLIKIDKWFKIFYNIENLLLEFEQLTKNESFCVELKKKDCLSLYIVFPINLLERIEIPIPINEIDNKDLFSQLITKINEIDSKDKNDINTIDEKLSNLEHLINNMEMNQNKDENENENLKENEHNENNEQLNADNMNNLEEMKETLKKEIENNIKNEDEEEKISHQNSDNDAKQNSFQISIDENHLPFQESTILSDNVEERQKELEFLLHWLSPSLANLENQPKVLYTKLLYKAENDGDKASTFHEKCDNISPTLTIIQTKEGYRYGGYTSVCWEAPEQSKYKPDSDAFIFSLDTLKKYECLDSEKSIVCSMSFGPNFGDGTVLVPDNFYSKADTVYPWPSFYNLNQKDELTLGNESKIDIIDYEVYAIELNNDE